MIAWPHGLTVTQGRPRDSLEAGPVALQWASRTGGVSELWPPVRDSESESKQENRMSYDDPFDAPAPIASEFPNAASFRGRLVIIKPTRFEQDAPANDGKSVADKVTATVTVVDGEGDVFLCPQQIPSKTTVPGPVYDGVWFQQDRIVKAVCPGRKLKERMTLGRLETYKPGQPAKQGNPWGLLDPTPADIEMARAFLKSQQADIVDRALNGPQEQSPF